MTVQAQLRSSVFAAINQDGGIPRSGQLQWLLSSEEGASLAALVHDFLLWAGLRQTKQVHRVLCGFNNPKT